MAAFDLEKDTPGVVATILTLLSPLLSKNSKYRDLVNSTPKL